MVCFNKKPLFMKTECVHIKSLLHSTRNTTKILWHFYLRNLNAWKYCFRDYDKLKTLNCVSAFRIPIFQWPVTCVTWILFFGPGILDDGADLIDFVIGFIHSEWQFSGNICHFTKISCDLNQQSGKMDTLLGIHWFVI